MIHKIICSKHTKYATAKNTIGAPALAVCSGPHITMFTVKEIIIQGDKTVASSEYLINRNVVL